MKFVLYSFLFLLASLTFGEVSYSLTNYQIKKICKKEKKEFTCIKNLREKRSILEKGNLIEIPVIPYENKKGKN